MPILSVVVPTHNRADYAISCIEAVLAFDAPDLQLVMTDTSTDRRLFERLHASSSQFLSDRRFIYRKIDEPSNLTKNHNDAIVLATGRYVCVIGDDDCITAAAVDAARWASNADVSVVSQVVSANYAWPDFRSRLAGRGHAARLYLPGKIRLARWRDSKTDLQRALGRALQGTDHLPRCYHGIVRRDLLEKIRESTGAYFHGSSPDMSGAVSLACLVDRYLEVDTPLTIPGASSGSNSGRSAMNTHKGELSSDRQTSGFETGGWTAGVPRFFSVETVWAHAGLESIAKLRPDLLPDFNYARLVALCKLRHPDFGSKSDAAALEVQQTSGRDMSSDVNHEIRAEKWARRWYLLRRAAVPTAANGRQYVAHLATVAEASRSYEKYARLNSISFTGVSLDAEVITRS